MYFSTGSKDALDNCDALIDIAVIYHECLLINIAPKELFYSVAKESTPNAKNLLTNFIERSDEDKSMEAFCLTKVANEDGSIEIECEIL